MTQRIIERAWRAYLAADGLGAKQPTSSSINTIDRLTYVTLRGERAVLAVYRLNTRGRLQRMKRWPMSLNTPIGSERAPVCTAVNASIGEIA